MTQINTKELIETILKRMTGITVERVDNRLVISHNSEDWDFLSALCQKLGFVATRWMQNSEPRTSIYTY